MIILIKQNSGEEVSSSVPYFMLAEFLTLSSNGVAKTISDFYKRQFVFILPTFIIN